MLAVRNRRNGNAAATVAPLRVRSVSASNATGVEQVVAEHLGPTGAQPRTSSRMDK